MPEISFRYFYDMFQNEFREKVYSIKSKRVGELEDDLDDIFDIYFTNAITPAERIDLYDEILFEICANYVSLSGTDLTVYPKSSFEFVDLILSTMTVNNYVESFLWSMQWIFHEYFGYMGKGSGSIRSGEEDELPPTFIITLNERYDIINFEAINMDAIEETQTMLRVLTLERNGSMGPIPKVVYKYNKRV